MIPKKIHYCWLSDDDMPEKLQQCIASWHKYLPDYEFIKWDLNRFPLDKSIWVRQAYERKKYAFAADYIRLYALATEGGIYLDSDVEVLKPFDDLLDLPYFICEENSPKGLEAATIGAEKGCEWVCHCLDYYKNKAFIDDKGLLRTEVLPYIMKQELSKRYSLRTVRTPKEVSVSERELYILPHEFFSPKSYVDKKLTVTSKTYSIHHFAGTWQPIWKKVLLRIWIPFSVKYPKLSEQIKKILFYGSN